MTLHVTTTATHEATGRTYTWEMVVDEADFEHVVRLADVPRDPADVAVWGRPGALSRWIERWASAEYRHSIAYTGVPLKITGYIPMEGETS